MEYKRGLLLFSPMGSGKSHYINNVDVSYILDGDILLENNYIKNKNDFWYDYTKKQERENIIEIFNHYLNLGYWIFYSGNPILMKPDIIVLPDKDKRWKQLQNRKEYKPTKEKFLREQKVYENACKNAIFYINGDIPSLHTLKSIHQDIIDQKL
jgi:hypothetical protein